MLQGGAGCRHTDKLQQQRGEYFLKKPEETEESFLPRFVLDCKIGGQSSYPERGWLSQWIFCFSPFF